MTEERDISEFAAFEEEFKKKMQVFKQEFGKEFKQRVEQRTPVISGKLKDGWKISVDNDSIDLGNKEDYVMFVEMGTIHMAPRGMVRTTILESDNIINIAKEKAGL